MDEFTKKAMDSGKAIGSYLRCLGCGHTFVLRRDHPSVVVDPDNVECPECKTMKCVADRNFTFESGTYIMACSDCDSSLMEISDNGVVICVRCGFKWSITQIEID